MDRKALGTHEIAKICQVTPATVGNWIAKGLLPTFSTGGGHHRVWPEDLVKFLKEHNIPVPIELENESKYKVLIVDDEPEVIEMVEFIIRNKYKSIDILSAENGFDAGQKVEMFKPNLIILDLRLPGIDGFEVCRNIKAQESLRKTKIIAISGVNEKGITEQALKSGADDFLAKPFSPEALVDKIEHLVEKIG